MTRRDALQRIVDYFADNEDVFRDCVEELDAYNGWLGDDRCYWMEEINEFYRNPLDALYRAFYGHDGDSWYYKYPEDEKRGDKVYEPFNPNRRYFYFNAYGNLVSTDDIDYSVYNTPKTVKELSERRADICAIKQDAELSELFDELEKRKG